MSFQNPITGGQGALIRPAIKSPNFVEGVSGWSIDRNGNAEFNDGTFRGTVTASTFEGTDFMINTDGAFFYNGTPGAGNLIASIAPSDGTDPYGNAYLEGLTTYAGGEYSSLANGSVIVGDATTLAQGDGGSLGIGNVADVLITSGSDTALPNPAYLDLLPGSTGTVPGAAGNPQIKLGVLGSAITDAWVSGALVKAQLGNPGTAWTWQAPGYNADWSGTATFNGQAGFHALQYRLDPLDNVVFEGAFTAVTGAAGTVFTLPAAYRPKMSCLVPCIRFIAASSTLASGMLRIDANGNVVVSAANGLGVAGGDQFFCNGSLPLGNIA
jgi:hypothetical protein